MNKSEIRRQISRLERSIADAERRRDEAEKNIRQLELLRGSCSDYQSEFQYARAARKNRLEDFDRISGQARLVGAYDTVLNELLSGPEYIRAYGGMDAAIAEINREIERQRQIIEECNSQIAGFRSSISHLRRELARAEQEERNARNRANNGGKLYR